MNGHGYSDSFWMLAHFGLWQLAIVFVFWWLIFGWPVAKILRRMGFSGFWVLLCFVPLGNIIGLWVMATTRWPRVDRD
ncbi:hypothetical protein [Martelella alba]|nr:hypothetical protein [Martelella alba]